MKMWIQSSLYTVGVIVVADFKSGIMAETQSP